MHQGIRDLEAIEALAESNHMKLIDKHDMPANNMLLVFRLDSA